MAEETLFDAALAVPEAERGVFLDRECGADTNLRARIDALLAAHDAPGGILDRPAAEERPPAPSDLTAFMQPNMKPDVVIGGRYTLLEKIGEGGMGEVWVAKQSEPVKRRVALKLIKAGMDSKAVLARFDQERQALAMMDHPNIAKVLDGGLTPTGQPYFVMELVSGMSLMKYCDDTKLTPRQRLELFIPICNAVQHAHQKGIVHRDLKPANILITEVDGSPVPKVIDFGVAKATAGKLTDESLFTQFGAVVGTLEYMAPEQAGMTRSEDIDTRADIYSLGVILYELLTGLKPIDAKRLKNTALLEMIRVIKEDEPAKPSTRLSTDKAQASLAASRHTDPKRLTAMLRGDLDCVIMKCLEKNRNRRYDTANGLAADIKRHLSDEPVIARPPSTAYRLQKAWQRNKLAYSAVGAVAAALLVGIAVSVWQATRARDEAVRAKTAEQHATAALDELRATAPAFAEQARGLAAKEQYADAIVKLDYAIKLRPDAAEFLVAKGDLLQCQLQFAPAAALYRDALRVQPGHARAEASAKLCDELLAAPRTKEGKLEVASLGKLRRVLEQQQRPAGELAAVDSELEAAKKLVRAVWLPRLSGLLTTKRVSEMNEKLKLMAWKSPVSQGNESDFRFTVRDDGGLSLNLCHTEISDLSILKELPIKDLYLEDCPKLTDVAMLTEIPTLENLTVPQTAQNIVLLRNVTNLQRLAFDRSGTIGYAQRNSKSQDELMAFMGPGIMNGGIADQVVKEFSNTALPSSTVADFWKKWDSLPWMGALHAAGIPYIATEIKEGVPEATSPSADPGSKKEKPSAASAGKATGMWAVTVASNNFSDCSIFKGADNIGELKLAGTAVADLQPFRGLKLTTLSLAQTKVTDLSPLAESQTLTDLTLPPNAKDIEFLRASTQLKRISYREDPKTHQPAHTAAEFWKEHDSQGWLRVLRASGVAIKSAKQLEDGGTWDVSLAESPIHDLTPLRGAPISILNVSKTAVADLEPLRGMALKELYIAETGVTDLTPLRGMRLTKLFLGKTKVADLSPLKGMPLEVLLAADTKVTDLSPLRGMPLIRMTFFKCPGLSDLSPLAESETLTDLTLPPNAKDIEFLRAFPKLERLGFSYDPKTFLPEKTAAEFWKEWDAKKK